MIKALPELFQKKGIDNVLIITDLGIRKLGLTVRLETALKQNGIAYSIYDKTVANPTTDNVEEAENRGTQPDARPLSDLAVAPVWTVPKQ